MPGPCAPAAAASSPLTGTALFHLVYVSSAVAPFSPDDLRALLERSRANNLRAEISGMLLYHEGNFMQALEGSERAVLALHTRILSDPRHTGALTLIQGPIERRAFSDWAMGFRALSSADLHAAAGFSNYLERDRAPVLPREPSRAWKLLETFRTRLR